MTMREDRIRQGKRRGDRGVMKSKGLLKTYISHTKLGYLTTHDLAANK